MQAKLSVHYTNKLNLAHFFNNKCICFKNNYFQGKKIEIKGCQPTHLLVGKWFKETVVELQSEMLSYP
jgi:hypothetical protein